MTKIDKWGKEMESRTLGYPNERVVGTLSRIFKNKDNIEKRALDIGFGSGRHLKLLKSFGFKTYGIEISRICVEHVLNKEWVDHAYYGDYLNLSKKIYGFDLILAHGVLFIYNTYEDVIERLEAIYSMLNVGGHFIVNFRSKDDYLYKMGEEIGEDNYIINNTNTTYGGIPYIFFTHEELELIFKSIGFNIVNIEREDYWENNLKYRNSWYIFTLKKECDNFVK